MATTIEIKISPSDAQSIGNAIARALALAISPTESHVTDFFRIDVTNVFSDMFLEIFAYKHDSTGKPWTPHAPKTIKKYGPHPLLILSTDLLQSLVDGNQYSVDRIGHGTYEYGTSLVYAAIQNFGGTAGNGAPIPSREYMFITDTAADKALDLFAERVMERLEKELRSI